MEGIWRSRGWWDVEYLSILSFNFEVNKNLEFLMHLLWCRHYKTLTFFSWPRYGDCISNQILNKVADSILCLLEFIPIRIKGGRKKRRKYILACLTILFGLCNIPYHYQKFSEVECELKKGKLKAQETTNLKSLKIIIWPGLHWKGEVVLSGSSFEAL